MMHERRLPVLLLILIPEAGKVVVRVSIVRIGSSLAKISRVLKRKKKRNQSIPTYKVQVFHDVTVLRAVGQVPFPELGQ